MGKPAARMGDMTAHGGTIVVGFPMVLIGGMPAARVADMHVCPMVTPAPTPVPHVGGPVLPPGSPTVLIGGMPAARMGDMATCTGPPDIIVAGCPTVLIGEGPGSGGGGGAGAVAAARASAHSSLIGESNEAEGPHWIQYQFVDSAGNPVTEVPYEYTCVDGHKEKSKLTKDGVVKRGGLPDAGNCTVTLFSVYNAKWSKESARVGDMVKLSAEVDGYDDGTKAILRIWEQDIKGADDFITEIETTVNGGKVEADWKYEYHEEEEEEWTEEEREKGYSSPEYYFEVHVEDSKARSGILEFQDWIEVELLDENEKPVPNEDYTLYLPNGEVQKGKLDGNGYKKVEKVKPGPWHITFPNLKTS